MINSDNHRHKPLRMTLHPRTLRKAREQVRFLMADGFSTSFIKNYLIRWTRWWVGTSRSWRHQQILQQFFDACWDIQISTIAMALMPTCITSDNKVVCRVDL